MKNLSILFLTLFIAGCMTVSTGNRLEADIKTREYLGRGDAAILTNTDTVYAYEAKIERESLSSALYGLQLRTISTSSDYQEENFLLIPPEELTLFKQELESRLSAKAAKEQRDVSIYELNDGFIYHTALINGSPVTTVLSRTGSFTFNKRDILEILKAIEKIQLDNKTRT